MKKFKLKCEQKMVGYIEVDAESQEEAIQKAGEYIVNWEPVDGSFTAKPVRFCVQNILKVVDIWHEEISLTTRDFLKEHYKSYTDNQQNLNEDLLDASNAWDENEENESIGKTIREELGILSNLCAEHDAGYIRIIYS